MTIEEYLEKPYWVIDILPKQVPAGSKGQYFEIEKCFREHPQIDSIYRKFTNILLKLNCYVDIEVSQDGDNWITNSAPKELDAALQRCMTDKQMLYVIQKSADFMITISGDDTYMTIYQPTEDTLELLGQLAASEGLFIWKP
jgi:hypothetical protein